MADDLLLGGGGDDEIRGNDGEDWLIGDAGNDVLRGGANDDTLDGGAGSDLAAYNLANAGVVVNLSLGTAFALFDASRDTLLNIENVTGGAFDDTLTGDSGANLLIGGDGSDILTGGAGGDTFGYGSVSQDGDTITDFKQAGDADQIDLSGISAGVLAFAGNTTAAAANSVNWYEWAGNTIVEADVDGTATADFQITLLGTGLNLTAADFVL